MNYHEPRCEVGHLVESPNPCMEPLHTVVPLPGGTGVFVCAKHAAHMGVPS